MATPPGRPSPGAPALTSLPRLEDIPQTGAGGYDPERVREAFDAFRRHAAQLQAQLRVLQAAGRSGAPAVEPTGHAVRMDALHLIRAAAEFADTVERDAQAAAAEQLARTEEEVTRRQRELQDREAAQELREAEARAARLLEQARHQATELTNAARAEVEQTLEWARAQAAAILSRAQNGAEQMLAAAGLGETEIGRVADAIVQAAQEATHAARTPAPARAAAS